MYLIEKCINIHKAIYKEEQPLKYSMPQQYTAIAAQDLANANASVTSAQQYITVSAQAHTQYVTAQAQTNVNYPPGYLGGGAGTGQLSGSGQLGQYGPVVGLPAYNPSPPMPMGSTRLMVFTQSDGIGIGLMVDVAHLAIMQQISAMNSVGIYSAPSAPTHPMLDGDFSFDEMDKAEAIIAELASGDKASQEQGIEA